MLIAPEAGNTVMPGDLMLTSARSQWHVLLMFGSARFIILPHPVITLTKRKQYHTNDGGYTAVLDLQMWLHLSRRNHLILFDVCTYHSN